MTKVKLSRVALAVIKLKVRRKPYFLMRINEAWGDISFVGGHVDLRDAELLERAAHRELLEEVPALKTERGFDLNPLTPQLHYGPVYSPSAKTRVAYDLQFFLVMFQRSPENVIASLRKKSKNLLVPEAELLNPTHCRVANLVTILNAEYFGGLSAIPYSWTRNLESARTNGVQWTLAAK